MSREATGRNGFVLGSSEYWYHVNSATILGQLMQNASNTNYQETLQKVGYRAGSAVEEIYDDLQNNINSVHAISSDRRSALSKQVQELYDVCNMAGSFCNHASDCIGILSSSSICPAHHSAMTAPFRKRSIKSRIVRISLPASVLI